MGNNNIPLAVVPQLHHRWQRPEETCVQFLILKQDYSSIQVQILTLFLLLHQGYTALACFRIKDNTLLISFMLQNVRWRIAFRHHLVKLLSIEVYDSACNDSHGPHGYFIKHEWDSVVFVTNNDRHQEVSYIYKSLQRCIIAELLYVIV
jgi:hypothetical protein